MQAAINDGRVTPGEKLVYADIARELNVSVTPVREAMKTLEGLGLVTVQPHRTAFVSYLTEDQIKELYELRILLEGMATKLAVGKMTESELGHLKRVYREHVKVIAALNSATTDDVRSRNVVALQRVHDEFHVSIYTSSRNRYLVQMIEMLRSQVTTYFPVINRYNIKRVNKSHQQHLAILTACEEREATVAASLMRRHLEQTLPVLLNHIRTHYPSTGGTTGVPAKRRILPPAGPASVSDDGRRPASSLTLARAHRADSDW